MKLITIATYTFPQDLLIDRSKLESAGIECFTQDELTAQVHNFISNAIGGVKLQVKETDVEFARQVLADSNNLVADYSESKIKCPHCGSGNVDGIGLNGRISMLILFITGLPVPVFSSKFKCYDCYENFKLAKTKKRS